MKNLLTVLLAMACLAVLFLGHSYWNEKIEAAPESKSITFGNQDGQDTTSEEGQTNDPLLFTKNWPDTAVNQFKQALKEKRAFKIVFAGSTAIGSDTSGMTGIVKQKLIESFGDKTLDVEVKTYDVTSTAFVESNQLDELAAEKADMLVIEPFILLNNGMVETETSLSDLSTIIDSVEAKNPDTTVIIQPSYPLFQAKIYPQQVAALKDYATQHKLTYLDHWSAWPDSNSATIKDYLTKDQSAPSDKGNQVWSQYLLDYLISK